MNRVLIMGASSTRIIGGVAIHNTRLVQHLAKSGWRPWHADLRSLRDLGGLTKLPFADIVHINFSNVRMIAAYAAISRMFRKRIVVTLHGNAARFSPDKERQLINGLRYADHVIALNEASAEYLRVRGLKRISVLSAFLPPLAIAPLPLDVADAIATLKAQGRTIFVTNAWRDNRDRYGQEIYGIRGLLELFSHRADWGLVIADPSASYRRSFVAEGRSLAGNVVLINRAVDFNALLQASDVMVRATSTDGDSISVREALYWGIPTVGSDAVERPDGVHVYRFGDNTSLSKTLSVAAARAVAPRRAPPHADDPSRPIADIYRQLVAVQNQ